MLRVPKDLRENEFRYEFEYNVIFAYLFIFHFLQDPGKLFLASVSVT